jgi:hypothetical protein
MTSEYHEIPNEIAPAIYSDELKYQKIEATSFLFWLIDQ